MTKKKSSLLNIIPRPIKSFLKKLFFMSPERVDKAKKVIALILVGAGAVFIIQFVGKKVKNDSHQRTFSDIASSLIPEFVGSIVVFWVLDSTFKQLYGITELPDLPLENFVKDMQSVKKVRILETFTSLATDNGIHENFIEAVESALEHGANIQILLIHPDSEGAEQRHQNLMEAGINVHDQIRLTLARFYKLEKKFSREASNPGKLEIKLYKSSPSIAIHMWDKDAYVSFFPVEERSDEAPNLKISMATTFGSYADSKFNDLWQHKETVSLCSYMELMAIVDSQPENYTEMLYCVRAKGSTRSYYVTNHFSDPLQLQLNQGCESNNYIKIISEEREHQATCSRLPDGDNRRSEIVSDFKSKYEWTDEDAEDKIRLNAILYRLDLSVIVGS